MNTMRMTFILVVALVLLNLSCKKEKGTFKELSCPVTTVEGPEDKIIGKWKLVSGYYPSQISDKVSSPNDYSCNNIIYEFKSDGKLLVTSDISEYVGHSPGAFDYEFSLNENHSASLSVDAYAQHSTLSSTKLDIDNTASDGWVLKLVRLE